MRTRRVIEKERGDEIKRLQKTNLHTQNTVYCKTKPNSLLKTEIKTRNSSVFSETQKSKPFPSPKIKIQNLDEKEVNNQRCHFHAISDSLTQWPPIHQPNSTSTLLLLKKKTLNKPQATTLLLLLSHPPDHLEEEEEEEEPTDEASDQPSVITVDSDAKYGEDSKSTVAAACSGGCC